MRSRTNRGITLIELLVVVTILVLLGAVVVPNLTPTIESRRLREASRGVDVFLAAAKAKAIRTGRPVGVYIKQPENNARAGLTLYQAAVPEDYSGDFYNHTMRVQALTSNTFSAVASHPIGIARYLSQGHYIQFESKGYIYKIDSIDAEATRTQLTLSLDVVAPNLPWSTAFPSNPLSFRIFRAPVVFASDFGKAGMNAGSSNFYQMPEGVAIDLAGSVFPGADVNIPAAPTNTLSTITIVFSPSGGVSAIYAGQAVRYLPTGSIHLLVGKLKNIQSTAAIVPTIRNWQDRTNFYVNIGHLTGQITVTEVAPISGASNLQEELWQATAYARDAFETGGR